MRAPFFVEILTRNGEVRQRHQVGSLPIRIGRGYDNECILDDPHAAANHAVVEPSNEGYLNLRDLGSKNGIICKGKRHENIPIEGDTVFRLGHTNLRVRSADFKVENEVTDTTSHNWEGWPPALAGLMLIVLLSVANTWVNDTQQFAAIRYLIATTGMLSVGLLWSGLWAFAGRLFGEHARFGRHLFILGCGFFAMQVWDLFSTTAAYAFSLEFLTRFSSHVEIAISAGMIFFHLVTINPRHPRRFAATSLLLAMLASGLLLMNNYQRNGRLGDELYMHTLLPTAIRHSPNKPVEQFISDAAQLKARVDEDRLKTQNGIGVEEQE